MWFHIQSFYWPIQNLQTSEMLQLRSLTTYKIPVLSPFLPLSRTGTSKLTVKTQNSPWALYKLHFPKGHVCQDCHRGTATVTSLKQNASCWSHQIFKWLLQNPSNILAFFAPLSLFPKANKQLWLKFPGTCLQLNADTWYGVFPAQKVC